MISYFIEENLFSKVLVHIKFVKSHSSKDDPRSKNIVVSKLLICVA